MKKIGLFILIVLLVIPFSVLAATKPSVKTLDANASGSTINYSGTMEDGSYAVMCKLYNSSDEELDLLSSSVDNNKFSGSFENLSDDTYTVYCANYEGGEIKTVSVVIKNEKVSEGTTVVAEAKDKILSSKNPKTGDNIMKYLYTLIISVIGLAINLVYIKKERLIKNK